MDNETTLPGLLTLPGALDDKNAGRKSRLFLYSCIFATALLVLILVFWLH